MYLSHGERGGQHHGVQQTGQCKTPPPLNVLLQSAPGSFTFKAPRERQRESDGGGGGGGLGVE